MTSQCPAQSLQSFPVNLEGFTPTYERYETLIEPISLSLTWGQDTTPPEFSQMANINSGELYHLSFNNTRLLYDNMNYALVSVQLTAPTHKSWLALTTPDAIVENNVEDIILTFTCESIEGSSITKTPQYIILVSPIIRTPNPRINPSFLESLANQTSVNVSPGSLFPNEQNHQYARYITCARGITSQSDFQNVMVIVNVQGLLVFDQVMKTIEDNYKKQKTGSYSSYIPIYYNLFSSTSATIQNMDFNTFVKVSRGYSTSVQTLASSKIVTETTDAYKCVPINPETQIDGAGLKVNSSTGEVLTTELANRKAQIDAYNSTKVSSIPYTILENYTRIFIVIAISITAIFIIVYTVLTVTVGPEATGVGGHTMLQKISTNILKVPVYVIIAFFCTFVGLMVGAFISPGTSTGVTPT